MKKDFAAQARSHTELGIALQGGGAYGAYAKGVLKALFNSKTFNSPDLNIRAVAGTSAGAVNGALVTYGLHAGGTAKAISVMDSFWDDIARDGWLNSMFAMFDLSGNWPNLPASATAAAHLVPKGFVCKQLKGKLERHVPDWDKLRNGPVKLFVNAVHEDRKTGKRSHKVFSGKNLSADAVTASGALEEIGPHVIDGERYFDGAYWRNPCTEDLEKEPITDMLIITLQEKPRDGITPQHQDKARAKHAKPGHGLITEEFHHHIAHLQQTRPDLRLHVISLEVEDGWDQSSRMNTDPRWLKELAQRGYDDGLKFLAAHEKDIGKKSSYQIPSPPAAVAPARQMAVG